MPRPHGFPRQSIDPFATLPFPAFPPMPTIRRELASLNVRRVDKALFDAMQAWASYREGRALHQYEVFTFLMERGTLHPELAAFSPPKAS